MFDLFDFNVGGSIEFNNTPRFIDNGNGWNMAFEPKARLYLPFSEDVSLYVEGGVNGQRFAFAGPDFTVINPIAGFGVRKQAHQSGGELAYSIQAGGIYYFDDINNSIGAPQFWRGYGFRLQGLRTRNGIGYFAGLDIDRQSSTTFVLQPGTQVKLRLGIAFGGNR